MQIQHIESFLDYLAKIHQRTMRVVRCIPADKLEWNYRESKFTLGDQVRHIATIERYMFVETVSGRPSRCAVVVVIWRTDTSMCSNLLSACITRALSYSLPFRMPTCSVSVRLPTALLLRSGNGCARWS